MAGELNTEVRDDPAACRSSADWLGRLKSGVQQIGDVSYRERGESESFWQGTAGDACRRELTDLGKDSDSLEEIVEGTKRALNVFADRIDTVRSRMDQARQVARDGGLIATPVAILPPGPGPGASPQRPTGPMSPDAEAQFSRQVKAHNAALGEHQAKQAAFQEASTTVIDARKMHEDAHRDLDKAMQDPLGTIKSMKTYGMFVFSHGLNTAKAKQGLANDLFKSADEVDEHARRMQEIAADPRNSAATRAAAEHAAQTSSAGAEHTRVQGEKAQLRGPSWARNMVEANPGNYIKDGTGWLKLGKNAARGVPFLGTGLAIGSGAWDVAMGKDPGVASAETGASIAGGVVGGMAGAEVGTAIGTMIFPGPGTAIGGVIGGVAGGIIGGMSATEGVDQAMGVK
jgi:hypothetical protein